MSHVSIVPTRSLPFLATNAISGFLSSHSIFVAEKYGSGRSPVRSAMKLVLFLSSAQRSVVRLSCHTIARASGLPVSRCQTTIVSR